jgi:hypothetical protein
MGDRDRALAPFADRYGSSLMGMANRFTNYLPSTRRQSPDEGPRGAQIYAVNNEAVYFEEGVLLMVNLDETPQRSEFTDTAYYSKRVTNDTPNVPVARVMPINALNDMLSRTPVNSYEQYSDIATKWKPLGICRVVHENPRGDERETLLEYVHYGMIKKMIQIAVLHPWHRLVIVPQMVSHVVNAHAHIVVRYKAMGIDNYNPPRHDLIPLGDASCTAALGHTVNTHWGKPEWLIAFVYPIGYANADPQVRSESFVDKRPSGDETGQFANDDKLIISKLKDSADAFYTANKTEQFHLSMPPFL